jgi:branched-chain amino acid transport system substrate-binding protein
LRDIKDAGLAIFSGNYVAVPWYWQANIPGAQEFADRFQKRAGERPHYGCAANYSAVWQYLDAVKRAGTKETVPVIKALRGHTFRDMWANPGTIRAEDQLQVGPVYILKAKTLDQLKEKEDYFEIWVL